eukprot:gene5297-6596_t
MNIVFHYFFYLASIFICYEIANLLYIKLFEKHKVLDQQQFKYHSHLEEHSDIDLQKRLDALTNYKKSSKSTTNNNSDSSSSIVATTTTTSTNKPSSTSSTSNNSKSATSSSTTNKRFSASYNVPSSYTPSSNNNNNYNNSDTKSTTTTTSESESEMNISNITKGRTLIDEGRINDEKSEYSIALQYYTDGIEKLLPMCKNNKELRQYVLFYMDRAEYLKTNIKNPNLQNLSQYTIQYNKQKQKPLSNSTSTTTTTTTTPTNKPTTTTTTTTSNTTPTKSVFSSFWPSKKEIIDVDKEPANYYTPPKQNPPPPSLSTSTSTTNNLSLKPSTTSNSLSLKPSTSTSSTAFKSKLYSSLNNRNPNTTLTSTPTSTSTSTTTTTMVNSSGLIIPDIKGVDKAFVALIMNEIMDRKNPVTWEDVVGLDQVKQSLMEAVILPSLRPDVFVGLRSPPKGLLLFGPPGNGKTMIAKAVAYESKATFFSISASSLTSKYVGEGEKLVRALFAVATHFQPSIIFIDEIDSLLTERSSDESDATRRLKTEILIQFDGVRTSGAERILVMGATNRPEELDEAALRRLVKRIYVGLPEKETRLQIIQHLLKEQRHSLTPNQLSALADATKGYSAFDLHALCKDAAYEPIRQLGLEIRDLSLNQIRSITLKDFKNSLKQIRPSVSHESLVSYQDWNQRYGTI